MKKLILILVIALFFATVPVQAAAYTYEVYAMGQHEYRDLLGFEYEIFFIFESEVAADDITDLSVLLYQDSHFYYRGWFIKVPSWNEEFADQWFVLIDWGELPVAPTNYIVPTWAYNNFLPLNEYSARQFFQVRQGRGHGWAEEFILREKQ